MKATYIRINQLIQILPISKASVWRMVKNGTFVKPVKLAQNITAWKIEDVNAWLAARHEGVSK